MLKTVICSSVLIAIVAICYNSQYLVRVINIFKSTANKGNLFTPEELSKYNGVDNKELYLSLLGNVFDVTKGLKHYGPGQSYNAFVGRDASRNFISGKFNPDDLSDDVIGVSLSDYKSLDYWVNFYKKEYTKVGKLIGRYYDENGTLTQYGKDIRSLIKKALRAENEKNEFKLQFPPCNAEWDVTIGSRVWCTKKSGGIERSWVGVPRKYYKPGSSNYRCVCISKENLTNGNIKDYEDCNPQSSSCYVKS